MQGRGNVCLSRLCGALLSTVVAVASLSFLPSCAGRSAEEECSTELSGSPSAPRNLSNFARLNESVWRSEQPSDAAFRELEKMGLKSVLNLREYHSDDDEAAGTGLRLYHVKLAAGSITSAQIEQCLTIIKNAPKPILIHCKHGADRTGTICAAYRIVFEGWSQDKAIHELTDGGYGFHGFWYPNIPKLIRDTDFNALRRRMDCE